MHTSKSIQVKHIVSDCSHIQGEIQRHLNAISTKSGKNISGHDLFRPIFTSINKATDRISEELAKEGASAADLPVRSRRGYQWLTFLTDPDHFQAHLQTLGHLYEMTEQLQPPRGSPDIDTTINLFLIGPLYRIRRQKKALSITAHESFIAAQPPVLRSLIQLALQRDREKSKNTIREFTKGDPYRKMRERMEYIAIPRQATSKGTHINLSVVFQKVNQSYFNGSLPQPHLVWSDRLTYRKFGHYQYETDTIMISRSLDDPHLPDCALDYVMYHELLHKKLGTKDINGRRYAHTKHFREKEKMFKEYKKAQSILEHLSQQLS
ncbi:MAG: hypothetical protein R6U57_12155 [Anaerolineales bacterium]